MRGSLSESKYLELLSNILDNGEKKSDRTGVGTLSVFGTNLKFSLENNTLPLLTTKKMAIKSIVEELLFFIRGDTDSKLLEQKGVNIWKGNTSREFLDKRGLFSYKEGEMGPMYGAQWRDFSRCDGQKGVDQLEQSLHLLKNDPNSRRILISAYNPNVSNLCVLDPCHLLIQFNVSGNNLSCQWYQRSVDSFLGLGFNITSYAILTHLMAEAAGLKAKELIFVGGDTHIYLNHVNQVKEQISRTPYNFPTISIPKVSSIQDMEKLSFEDFKINNYISHPSIKAEMAI